MTVALPEGESLMSYIKYLLENRNNERCVGDVFEKLLERSSESTSEDSPQTVYDSAKKKIIMKAMNFHLAIKSVVVNGLKLIASQLSTTGDVLSLLALLGGIASCSANDSAYSYIFFCSVFCLSVCMSHL